MPRYFFDSIDGHRERDHEGIELHGELAAQAAAIRYAGEVLALQPTKLADHGQWRVEVTDEQGLLLFTVYTAAVSAAKNGGVVSLGS